VPFSQSLGWYKYQKEKGNQIVFYVDDMNDPKICFWGIVISLPVFKNIKILKIDGEVYANHLTEKVFKKFYADIARLNHAGIEINSNNKYNIEYEVGLRRAGFIRPVGYFSCPLSIVVDLKGDFHFDNNWKRNVKKAVKENLVFKEIKEFTDNNLSIIIDMFNEMAAKKKLGYLLEKDSLKQLVNSKDIRTFFVFNAANKPVAARIIHQHNNFSSDVYAANSNEARTNGATYFMMENIFNVLKKEGKKSFDFSRIPPSTHASDSVYIFKNASRGEKIQYNGEWVYYKSSLIEGLMYYYKRFFNKKQRY
jgi:hypothetical protein